MPESTARRVNTPSFAHAILGVLADVPQLVSYGKVTRVVGLVIEATGLDVGLGELCRVTSLAGDRSVLAEVVGFHERGVLLMPLGDMDGLHPGSSVRPLGRSFGVDVGPQLLGRILNGLGHPIDGKGKLEAEERVPLSAEPPNPLVREMVTETLETGVRAIDGCLTFGRGQRVGIFAGSGVGKSTLLGMIARQARADVNVIALLGERGREVREFIEHSLGPEGLARSVLVVATGDQAALVRARGALVATAIAEYFRDQGKQVLLMVDSVTRVAMAWREIGLAVGEPPTTKGYPPSVFAALPRLLERAGNGERGGITGIYTGARGRRRLQRAGGRRRALDPRRPRGAHAQAGRRRALPRPSTCSTPRAACATTSSRPSTRRPPTCCSSSRARTARRRT
jgi:FliI/YscN family ATPase